MSEPRLILGIGELLWDVLPEGQRLGGVPIDASSSMGWLGGAPTNFTVMAGRFGNHAAILSRIGRDDLGRAAVHQLDPLPADTSFLQIDPVNATGQATVSFHDGNAEFTIHRPAAWDALELSDEWVQLAERADAICFGSLAQRSIESRQTIQTLAAQTQSRCIRIFDVNLRRPFYSSEIMQESLELATVVKMNDAELTLVLSLLGMAVQEANAANLLSSAERLLEEFPSLQMVAVTRGPNGSLLVTRDEWHEHPGFPVKVADTIGAGDAFAAALAHYLLRGAELSVLNEAGNRWGSWIATQSGAMPPLPEKVKAEIDAAIEQSA